MLNYFGINIFTDSWVKKKREARKEMLALFPDNFLGNIMMSIYQHHKESGITYELDEKALEKYESIVDRYAGQFNLKYACKYLKTISI